MEAEQISVFLENRAGRLSELVHLLAQANLNIRALSLADTSDFGILRLIVCDLQKAKNILKENGFTIGSTTVVAVEIEDQPGGLDRVLQLVSNNGINVEYMYAFTQRMENKAIMIFRFDKAQEAILLLREHGFTVISGQNLCAM